MVGIFTKKGKKAEKEYKFLSEDEFDKYVQDLGFNKVDLPLDIKDNLFDSSLKLNLISGLDLNLYRNQYKKSFRFYLINHSDTQIYLCKYDDESIGNNFCIFIKKSNEYVGKEFVSNIGRFDVLNLSFSHIKKINDIKVLLRDDGNNRYSDFYNQIANKVRFFKGDFSIVESNNYVFYGIISVDRYWKTKKKIPVDNLKEIIPIISDYNNR